KVLGRGFMGDVVAGYDKVTSQMYAFKQVSLAGEQRIAQKNDFPAGVVDPEAYIRQQGGGNISEIGICRDRIEINGDIIKVYELATESAASRLDREGALSPQAALDMVIPVAGGLEQLH